MKIKTTYSVKDYEKLWKDGVYDTLCEGDKIKMNFELPGKEGLYPAVKCEKESATLIQKKDGNLLFVMDRNLITSFTSGSSESRRMLS